jgi:hypothetical protein
MVWKIYTATSFWWKNQKNFVTCCTLEKNYKTLVSYRSSTCHLPRNMCS